MSGERACIGKGPIVNGEVQECEIFFGEGDFCRVIGIGCKLPSGERYANYLSEERMRRLHDMLEYALEARDCPTCAEVHQKHYKHSRKWKHYGVRREPST